MNSSVLASLHEAHKARQNRIKQAAIKIAKIEPAPPPLCLVEVEPCLVEVEPEVEIAPPEEKINLRNMTTFEVFMYEICRFYNVRKLDLLSARRIKQISDQRMMLAYMLYRMTSFTNPQIAQRMKRDPTTIYYAIKKIMGNLEAKMPEIQQLEKRIEALLEQRKAQIAEILT